MAIETRSLVSSTYSKGRAHHRQYSWADIKCKAFPQCPALWQAHFVDASAVRLPNCI